ncbi:glycosyltransferase [Carnobacterium maltaromaticum]|uniref:glycosyltransferase n=1 Tax=Carnobacterium maltaromaticum TaxID=2751 RepID=UPI00191BA80A|nr:glycosyltransferase [Carnobacterium maltaromaticum]
MSEYSKYYSSIFNNHISNFSDDVNIEIKKILKNQNIDKLFKEFKDKEKISFVLMTFNEERCIERCLNSILAFADEIIIIDTGSNDKTLDIIKNFSNLGNIILYSHTWNNDFSEIRNLLTDYATNDWIFQIDADEFIIKKDFKYLKELMFFLDISSISPKIISPMLIDHDLSETLHTKRIYKKDDKLRYFGSIHEELRYNNSSNTPYMFITYPIYHDGYMSEVLDAKQKYLRNYNLLKEMIKVEPNNIRWYYFLVREASALEISNSAIINIAKLGLELSSSDESDFRTGLLTKLMELNLNEYSILKNYSDLAKKNNKNCMDIYYYELLGNEIFSAEKHLENLTKNIKEVFELENPFSLINSNGDHLFLAWGWSYFELKNYDLAITMWNKISSEDITNSLVSTLKDLNGSIENFINTNRE